MLLHQSLETLNLIEPNLKSVEYRMRRSKKEAWMNVRAVHIFSLFPMMFKSVDREGRLLAKAHREYLEVVKEKWNKSLCS